MSISREERVENLHHALGIFLQEAGDQYYKDVFFSNGGAEYEGILRTTWQDLLDGYYLDELLNGHYFALTSGGWLKALEVTGRLSDPSFMTSLGKISKALKDRVKGRHEQVLVTSDEIAKEAEVSVGLVQSVIESGLLRYRFNTIEAEWASYDDHRLLIVIPVNFGLEAI